MIRQLPSMATKAATSRPEAIAMPGRAKYRSTQKAVMPKAPSGTRPISTVRRDSFSHSSEPTPVPTENSTKQNRYKVLPPPRCNSA